MRQKKRKATPKPKRKFAKYPPGQSPTEVGRAAQCSRVLAYRLLKRGMTRQEIVERAAERRRRLAERCAAGGANSDGNGAVPVKGGTNGSESFSDAQRRRESAQADIRELQAAEKRRQLVPIAAVNAHFAGVIVKAREIGMRIGPELGDRLAACAEPSKCAEFVTREVRRVLGTLTLFGRRYADALAGSGPRAEKVQSLAREIIAELDMEPDRAAPEAAPEPTPEPAEASQ